MSDMLGKYAVQHCHGCGEFTTPPARRVEGIPLCGPCTDKFYKPELHPAIKAAATREKKKVTKKQKDGA